MISRKTLVALAAFAALGLTGAACDKSRAHTETARDLEKAEATTPPEPPKPAAPPGTSGALQDLPGMDFSSLPPAAQQELAAVFSDEFCYCGCPHTIGQCLKTHTQCRHARRMANLAAAQAAVGIPAPEISVLLGRYYQSFHERKDVAPDPRLCQGPADAKITLVEYSDFECPYCGAAAPLLEGVVKKRPEVRLCYAPFPLQNHPHGMPAAQAALFARDKGRFWEMHDALFAHQTELSREKILELAQGLGLPKAELAKALDSGRYADEARRSRDAGLAAGVNHTPTVYVNGRELLLPLSEEALLQTVDDELEWQANSGWAKD